MNHTCLTLCCLDGDGCFCERGVGSDGFTMWCPFGVGAIFDLDGIALIGDGGPGAFDSDPLGGCCQLVIEGNGEA